MNTFGGRNYVSRIITSAMFRRSVVFAIGQALTQALTVLAGLLVVRFLDYANYSIYFFAGTLIGVAASTSDLGTGRAVIVFTSKAGSVIERQGIYWSADALRRRFLLLSTPIVAALFFSYGDMYTILQIQEVAGVFFLICVVFVLQNLTALRRAYLAAERNFSVINRADPIAAALRLLIIATAFIAGWNSNILVPMVATVIAALVIYLWMRAHQPPRPARPDLDARRTILRFIKSLIPENCYFTLRSILPILGLGWFATPRELADLGALSRLALAATLLYPMITYIAQPYVARGARRQFLWRGLAVIFVVASFGAVLVISGTLFPEVWLLVIGSAYSHLGDYVWIVLLLASLEAFNASLTNIVLASGHASFQYIAVVTGILAQTVLLITVPIVDLDSAYTFFFVLVAVAILTQSGLFIRAVYLSRSLPVAHGGPPTTT